MSGVTDPYQPVERRLQLTRRCLEILGEYRNPVVIVTKSALVTRDVDVLTALARDNAAAVFLSVTTLDGYLARLLTNGVSGHEAGLHPLHEHEAAC
jgi:DNA repair photolyase